ncbi:MAG: 1-(5-phosphoribosyl)-5-[(5-phosphoribosylamino)methylideneamino]imidazole-4-carboxamide isomerase [Candidatus Omnitrophota bacterium]|nr:1-(5-phosphoribosyl)-5-[(5-phosphoribosylamino)methylideneamino]imidazole-4-carboxamide isomerase [Candidatus Omnitrophota bacterium]
MIVVPAIDLKDEKVVRLLQGKFNEETIYSHNPLEIAKQWQRQGAELIHVVDLDGAQTGQLKNLKAIAEIAHSIKTPIEVGGGIRNEEDIAQLFALGVARVILGTKVLEDEGFVKNCIDKWQERVVVSIDSSLGKVANHGWTSVTSIRATDLAKKMEALGIKEIIYTEISRDGTLSGPNITGIKSILGSVKIPVIASGGISSLEDIKNLKYLEKDGLKGVIVGKALYEGIFSLREAINLCLQKE